MILHLVTSDPADAPSRFVPAGHEWPPPRKDAPAYVRRPNPLDKYTTLNFPDDHPLAERMRAYYRLEASDR